MEEIQFCLAAWRVHHVRYFLVEFEVWPAIDVRVWPDFAAVARLEIRSVCVIVAGQRWLRVVRGGRLRVGLQSGGCVVFDVVGFRVAVDFVVAAVAGVAGGRPPVPDEAGAVDDDDDDERDEEDVAVDVVLPQHRRVDERHLREQPDDAAEEERDGGDERREEQPEQRVEGDGERCEQRDDRHDGRRRPAHARVDETHRPDPRVADPPPDDTTPDEYVAHEMAVEDDVQARWGRRAMNVG